MEQRIESLKKQYESKILENNAEHVSAEVKRQLLNDPQFAFLGNSKEERKKKIREMMKEKGL